LSGLISAGALGTLILSSSLAALVNHRHSLQNRFRFVFLDFLVGRISTRNVEVDTELSAISANSGIGVLRFVPLNCDGQQGTNQTPFHALVPLGFGCRIWN